MRPASLNGGAIPYASLFQEAGARHGVSPTLLAAVTRGATDAGGAATAPHDAMALGAVTGVGMLFLRNPDGISHHPDEDVSLADVQTGLTAMVATVEHLAREAA